MKKSIIIFASIILGHFTALTQNDSISTIKLQRINDYGKPVEKILYPLRGISILTNSGKKFHLDTIRFIGDSIIIAKNENIYISNIIRVCAKRKGAVNRIIFGSLTGLAGTFSIFIGMILPVRSGEGLDSPPTVDNTNNIIFISTGIGLITTGISINFSRQFDTKNKWLIKSGQYSYNK